MRTFRYFLFFAADILWDQSSAATELEDRAAVFATSNFALLHGDSVKLEALSSRARIERVRTSSGLWKLALFCMSMADAIAAVDFIQWLAMSGSYQCGIS
jgi:hypothetical protein